KISSTRIADRRSLRGGTHGPPPCGEDPHGRSWTRGTVARELAYDASWRNCDDSRLWICELTADTPPDHRDGRGVTRTLVHRTLISHMGIWRFHGEEDRGVLRWNVEHAPDRNERLPHISVSSRERGLAARGHPQGGRADMQRPRL